MIAETTHDQNVGHGEFLLAVKEYQVSVSVNSCLVEIDGESAVLSVMTDITDLKRMNNTFFTWHKRGKLSGLLPQVWFMISVIYCKMFHCNTLCLNVLPSRDEMKG